VPDPAVVNASPLILLAKAGRLELLRALGRDLIVPQTVVEELGAKGSDDPVLQSVENAGSAENPLWNKASPTGFERELSEKGENEENAGNLCDSTDSGPSRAKKRSPKKSRIFPDDPAKTATVAVRTRRPRR
jgi:hypothetical protein